MDSVINVFKIALKYYFIICSCFFATGFIYLFLRWKVKSFIKKHMKGFKMKYERIYRDYCINQENSFIS